jgi:hypothetical protein
MPNIIDNEELYGVIVLGGVTSPGKVTLSGHDRKINWDVKAGHSLDGATMTLKDVPPCEFTASFYLVKDFAEKIDDYTAWDAFLPVINSTVKGTTPKAVDIYHPDLAENDIKSVCKSQIGGRTYDGKGGCTIVVKFQEYRAPKKKGGSPTGSAAKPQPDPNDPNAAQKAELAALTAQYQNTPWG